MTANDLELTHPADIASLLQELVASQAVVHISPPGGGTLSLPAQQLRDGELWLRLPLLQTPPTWLLQGPLHAHALLARVRIDFELGRRRMELVDGRPTLRVAQPSRLQRHQRRQSFRVSPVSALHPRLMLPQPDEAPLRLAVRDISGGGMALRWPADRTLPPPTTVWHDAVLELSRDLRLPIALRVEHVQDGFEEAVIGCAFVNLNPQAERQLLQHLQLLQRRQRRVGA